ncbi:glucose-6-phosphate dehydrogenase [Oxalicibacterium solurbis]|uniref:Glucose-6-phosphate 1-dehydrogenase n=1 Tax=Oxalicibacterium solurbis TaxID=69280 RepID=A0A8J3B0U5_9BURK|nr:glucose-6-phosphate dehydrogenase [Oxalicibacterium solurbis]GGI55026.1 glucose-6-phosphate 1-dehydrogenase [Oxalicibacterium solurbis]
MTSSTTHAHKAPKATLVIFGINGDLSHRLLMPSLINMTADGLIGDDLTILGIGRAEDDDESLRRGFETFKGEAGGEGALDMQAPRIRDAWQSLRSRLFYLRGNFGDADLYQRLHARFDQTGNGSAVFYLATAPHFFGDIVERLATAELLDESSGFRRIAIEKPFGHDLTSARELNARILTLAHENQLYRIDHFLGKETVQNIMVARFANTMMEAVWNRNYIDHVQITAAETVGVGTRGAFYNATGALRDMVPNHLFQILAMIAMEPPNSFDAEAIRNEKAKVFRAVRGPTDETVAADAVRGVYTAGKVGGKEVGGYRATPDVAPDSRTETYAALKLAVDSWRWAGVPFYLRTGKALAQRDTEVVVHFKPVPFAQFQGTGVILPPANKLVIQLQPNAGIAMDLVVKRPGPAIETAPVRMDFCYGDTFDIAHATGYETLIYDMLIGDQTLFQRADGVEAAWAALQPVIDAWQAAGEPQPYAAGSDGPQAADELIERDGRQWHRIGP